MEGIKEGPPLKQLARQLTDADRLRKVIQELMDTEKSYVKVIRMFCIVALFSPTVFI